MNSREIPVEQWRRSIIDKTNLVGNGVNLTVVPDIGLGDTDFRLLPDTVFEACTRFVIDFCGRQSDRELFSLLYGSKLEEHRAVMVHRSIRRAESDKQRLEESSGLSFDQQMNFSVEIENNHVKIQVLKARVASKHEIIRKKISTNPEFEQRFNDCENAYNELLVLAMEPLNDDQPSDILDIVDMLHELIGINLYEFRLPPINHF